MQKILCSLFAIFFLLVASAFNAFAQGGAHKTKIEDLPVHQQKLFLKAQQALDDWSGEYEKLVLAGSIIDSLEKTIPDFLPLYIEKARLIIMTGGTGNNDFTRANNEALKVLLDLQKKAPSYAKPYVLAGHAYTNIGNYPDAESNLAKAVDLKSTDPWLYNNLAQLKGLQGKQSEVEYYAKKALLLSGSNSKALLAAIYFFW
jgi:tetratricopeptide (TPR) repeat protein